MNQHTLSLALSAVRFSSCTARFSLTHMNAEPIHGMALPSWEADVVRHNSRRASVAAHGLWRMAARAWHEPPGATCSVVSASPSHSISIKNYNS